MDNRVLVISEKVTMLVNALIEGLGKASFSVTPVGASVEEMQRIDNPPMIWVYYLQGVDADLHEFHSFLQKRVEESGETQLFLIGNPEELREAVIQLSQENVRGTFPRPFRVDEVAERIHKEIGKLQTSDDRKRILLVDDDPTMLRTLKVVLSEKYLVYTANSGLNAIQILARTEVDLILLDYEMPVVKGPQVLEMLRNEENTAHIPVMFLTAKADVDAVKGVLSLHPEKYLLKTLPQYEICKVIDTFFEENGME
ncbi:MAG: response regulator [Lachnospiraceae bacterium]|nr:response regulator [Lachnospiraceae bacterium]